MDSISLLMQEANNTKAGPLSNERGCTNEIIDTKCEEPLRYLYLSDDEKDMQSFKANTGVFTYMQRFGDFKLFCKNLCLVVKVKKESSELYVSSYSEYKPKEIELSNCEHIAHYFSDRSSINSAMSLIKEYIGSQNIEYFEVRECCHGGDGSVIILGPYKSGKLIDIETNKYIDITLSDIDISEDRKVELEVLFKSRWEHLDAYVIPVLCMACYKNICSLDTYPYEDDSSDEFWYENSRLRVMYEFIKANHITQKELEYLLHLMINNNFDRS